MREERLDLLRREEVVAYTVRGEGAALEVLAGLAADELLAAPGSAVELDVADDDLVAMDRNDLAADDLGQESPPATLVEATRKAARRR